MLTIVTICARGGSLGVPGKNTKLLFGKPLIAYTIEQAKVLSSSIDHIFVSTDAESIAAVARDYGAQTPFMRPASLATDDASKLDVITHLVEWVETHIAPVGTIIDLDPTSPLRDVEDIRMCLRLLEGGAETVITGYRAEKNPYFNMVETATDGSVRLVKQIEGGFTSRQSAPEVYSMNGSIYVWRRETLCKGLWGGRTRLHVMPRERSVDIDEPLDFMIVEMLMKRRLEESTNGA